MGLRSDIRNELVSTLPLREPVLVAPTTVVRDAVGRMKQAHLGCVFVVDSEMRPLGKFTERQMIRVLVQNLGGMDEPIKNHMIPIGRCMRLDDRIADVVEEMQESGVRFVCVVDGSGAVIRLAGQRSVMEYIAEHFPRQIKVQMMEAKLHMDQREGA